MRRPNLYKRGAAILFAALLSFGAAASALAAETWKTETSKADVNRIPIDASADRLILVEGYDGTQCRVSLYVRDAAQSTASLNTAEQTQGQNQTVGSAASLQPQAETPAQSAAAPSEWKLMLSTNGALGANGIGKEREGDSKTPQGLFTISPFAFGNADVPKDCALPYHKVTANDYWCGDSASPYYDQLVDITKTGAVFDTAASEHLSRYGRYYNYCLNIDYNKDHTPYKGSALFLHCNSHDGSVETTHGCIAVNQDVMAQILANVSAHTWILIDEAENIPHYYQ